MKRAALLALAVLLAAAPARADGLADSGVLDRPRAFQIESARLRFTFFDQVGRGFQSLAGNQPFGPGSEQLTVSEPQLEVIAKQGERITHRIWVPVDIVSAASPDAIDVVSSSSRVQEAGTVDITSTYKASKVDEISTRFSAHLEENFRSWSLGLGWLRHLADDNAIIQASVNQTFDWFDGYLLGGARGDRRGRATTNFNLGLSQILSTTTVANINYGLSVQSGELGNTWNTIALADGTRDHELFPKLRYRHSLVGRLVQGLPWRGSIKVSYRFYADTWGALAQTIELFLYQRINRYVYLRGTYRAHLQKGVDFFQEIAPLGDGYRTADSDLATFDAHTFGGKVALQLPLRRVRMLELDLAYERYVRSNDLRVNVYSCSLGLQF